MGVEKSASDRGASSLVKAGHGKRVHRAASIAEEVDVPIVHMLTM